MTNNLRICYLCMYLLFMHVCMCSFICFTVITHFLPFLTSSKASRLKSRHEIKTDLITLLLTLLLWLCMIHQCMLLQRQIPVFVICHQNAIIHDLKLWNDFSLMVMSARPDFFNPAPSIIYSLHPASCADLMQDTHQFGNTSQYRTKKLMLCSCVL